jgi:hypothetical protein
MPEEIAALNYTVGGLSHPMLATLARHVAAWGVWRDVIMIKRGSRISSINNGVAPNCLRS